MTSDFAVVLRGYDRGQVERLIGQADAALASPDEAVRGSAREALQNPALAVVLRGYDRGQVDDAVRERLEGLGSVAVPDAPLGSLMTSSFVVVLRGYDMTEVDEAFARCDAAAQSDDAFARAAARDALRGADFRVRLRGYDRGQVDHAVREAVQRLS
ncbi:hypothetical protein [Catenuloplanes japonicus]|uniref:hypothetical protein n=1 Tax=Catenuloplanes japonicus TaxID=33876 RepID=UPI0012FCB896|nr:hypothetical protein [Catenuloplanes japonicus]